MVVCKPDTTYQGSDVRQRRYLLMNLRATSQPVQLNGRTVELPAGQLGNIHDGAAPGNGTASDASTMFMAAMRNSSSPTKARALKGR